MLKVYGYTFRGSNSAIFRFASCCKWSQFLNKVRICSSRIGKSPSKSKAFPIEMPILIPENCLPVKNGGKAWRCINSSRISEKIAEFTTSVDLDEVAHNEPPHLHLHCLPSSL